MGNENRLVLDCDVEFIPESKKDFSEIKAHFCLTCEKESIMVVGGDERESRRNLLREYRKRHPEIGAGVNISTRVALRTNYSDAQRKCAEDWDRQLIAERAQRAVEEREGDLRSQALQTNRERLDKFQKSIPSGTRVCREVRADRILLDGYFKHTSWGKNTYVKAKTFPIRKDGSFNWAGIEEHIRSVALYYQAGEDKIESSKKAENAAKTLQAELNWSGTPGNGANGGSSSLHGNSDGTFEVHYHNLTADQVRHLVTAVREALTSPTAKG
jgi:hypothetical protein